MTAHESIAMTTTGSNSMSGIGEMSVQSVVDRKRKLVEVMQAVMVDGEHYGKIPGCGDKPALMKSGAEILALTFGLSPTFQIIQTDLPREHREYRVVCTLTHIASGKSLGEGVGCCSTMESKYRWRGGARLCPSCGRATIIAGKAEYGGGWLCFAKKGGCGSKWPKGAQEIESQSEQRQENSDPADQYNTVLKMAKKRAQVDATLTATGASDILTQDLEDLPPASSRYTESNAVDAEFVDRPSQPSSGSATRPASNGQSKSAPRPDEAQLDDAAAAVIAKLPTATLADITSILPMFASLPKGTPQRDRALVKYMERERELKNGAPA